MRKLLFIAVAFFLAISAGAQTIDSPLKLELGRNLLDNPWSEDEIYYSYTAPADQEVTVLCTRTWEFYTRAMKCNADGSHTALDYYNGFDKAMGSATTIFRVKGGEKYLVAISTDASISQVPFTVAVEAMPYDLGMSCGTPMQLGDEAVCMPLGYSAVNGFTPVYGTFTPDHESGIQTGCLCISRVLHRATGSGWMYLSTRSRQAGSGRLPERKTRNIYSVSKAPLPP